MELEKKYETAGKHVIVDLWGVDSSLSNDAPYLKQMFKSAIEKSKATFISLQEKQFEPEGVTILIMLEESHLSYHSYPSDQYAAIDLFTCGDADPNVAIDYIIEQLKPKEVYKQIIERGVR